MKSEESIQNQLVMWFNNEFCLNHHDPKCLIFSVPNEGKDIKEQMRKKALGLKKGVSDLILVFPNLLVFVEVKDEIGKQRPEQIQFETDVQNLGFQYWLIRNLDEFKIKVNNLNK